MNKSIIETQGVKATTAYEQTLKNCDLDWEVQEDEVGGLDTAIKMPRKKLLYRSDNNAPLGIVGKDYQPSDPRDFVRTQYDFAEFIGGQVAQVGFIPDRARAFAFVNFKDFDIQRGGSRAVGDPLKAYIYSTDGWDGGTPRRSRLYIERLTCSNGQSTRKLEASMWVSHTPNMFERYSAKWKPFLAEIRAHVDELEATFQKLAGAKMNQREMDEFLVKLMPGESTMTTNRRSEISALFATGDGNHGNTRWDAYNAVTQYVTHNRSYRGNDSTSLETNRFLGVLENDTLAEKALVLLN